MHSQIRRTIGLRSQISILIGPFDRLTSTENFIKNLLIVLSNSGSRPRFRFGVRNSNWFRPDYPSPESGVQTASTVLTNCKLQSVIQSRDGELADVQMMPVTVLQIRISTRFLSMCLTLINSRNWLCCLGRRNEYEEHFLEVLCAGEFRMSRPPSIEQAASPSKRLRLKKKSRKATEKSVLFSLFLPGIAFFGKSKAFFFCWNNSFVLCFCKMHSNGDIQN